MNIKEINQLINSIQIFCEKRGFRPINPVNLLSPLYNYPFTPSAGHHFIDPIMKSSEPQPIQTFNVLEKCIRTLDFDKTGLSKIHLNLFEMFDFGYVGNDIKLPIKDSVNIFFDLLTNYLKLNKDKFLITAFGGAKLEGKEIKAEEKLYNEWIKYFPKDRVIYTHGRANFFYSRNNGAPGGSGVEFYYLLSNGKYVEIASQVHYGYIFEGTLKYKINHALAHGIGVERLLMAIENVPSIYDTGILLPVKNTIIGLLRESKYYHLYHDTIDGLVDLIRCICFLVAEGQTCDNTSRGKILNKFIKKVYSNTVYLGITNYKEFYKEVISCIIETMRNRYPLLHGNEEKILKTLLARVKTSTLCE